MTGCPALYELDFIGKKSEGPAVIQKIAFSLGVSYYYHEGMRRQMLQLIEGIANRFGKEKLTVYLHHKLNLSDFKHRSMLDSIEQLGVKYEDISGSEEGLVRAYGECDYHVGYRVHAHVHASSMSRPSILLNEDARGKGFYTVMGGTIIDAYYTLPRFNRQEASLMYKAMGAIKKLVSIFNSRLPMEPYEHLAKDVLLHMAYEMEHGFPRMQQSRASIDVHYVQMKRFIEQLP
jgi:polysaccharide pyruvyl transferase WcaK-like protein